MGFQARVRHEAPCRYRDRCGLLVLGGGDLADSLCDHLFHAATWVRLMEERATTPKALWMLIVAAPVIVAIAMQANYVLVRQACSAQRHIALYAVSVVSIALILATAVIAFLTWRVEGTTWPREEADLPSRIRFVAVLG